MLRAVFHLDVSGRGFRGSALRVLLAVAQLADEWWNGVVVVARAGRWPLLAGHRPSTACQHLSCLVPLCPLIFALCSLLSAIDHPAGDP